MKLKYVKFVLDLTKPKKYIEELRDAKTEGGMKLYRIGVGRGSNLIIGTYGDEKGTVTFMSFHLLYIDLLMQICELDSVLNPS